MTTAGMHHHHHATSPSLTSSRRCCAPPEALEVGVKGVAPLGSHAHAHHPRYAVLQHPVLGRGRGARGRAPRLVVRHAALAALAWSTHSTHSQLDVPCSQALAARRRCLLAVTVVAGNRLLPHQATGCKHSRRIPEPISPCMRPLARARRAQAQAARRSRRAHSTHDCGARGKRLLRADADGGQQ